MTKTAVTCTLEEAKAQVGQEGACLSGEEREITVLVHPEYTQDQVAGVRKELDALSRRYSKELGGVVVAYEKLRIMSPNGWLFHTNPYIHLRVSARFIVFCPAVGDTLKAVVRKKSPHHLGCLAHGSFNISVARPARESVEVWGGTLAAEGDTLTLTVLFTSLTSYLMPFIRASIHPDCVKELQERAETTAAEAAEGETSLTSAENDGANVSNTRTIFNDDSGISSNEAEETGKTQNRKQSEEMEEKNEESVSKKKKKKRKKDCDGVEEESEMRKKKQDEVDGDVTRDVGEGEEEANKVRRKKRKRNEEEDEGEEENKKRKKRKKRESDNYSEAIASKIGKNREEENDREEDKTTENITPSKKKKDKKKKKLMEGEEEAKEGCHIEEEEPPREAVHPLMKIKMEKMSSDEAEETRKKNKKKKKKQQQEKEENLEEDDDWIRKTVRNIKQEKFDQNERTKESMKIKQERKQTEDEEAGEIAINNTPSPTKKKKQKMKIKEEIMSSDERRNLNDLPVPLFMIKREKNTPESKIKAKTKKEKG